MQQLCVAGNEVQHTGRGAQNAGAGLVRKIADVQQLHQNGVIPGGVRQGVADLGQLLQAVIVQVGGQGVQIQLVGRCGQKEQQEADAGQERLCVLHPEGILIGNRGQPGDGGGQLVQGGNGTCNIACLEQVGGDLQQVHAALVEGAEVEPHDLVPVFGQCTADGLADVAVGVASETSVGATRSRVFLEPD